MQRLFFSIVFSTLIFFSCRSRGFQETTQVSSVGQPIPGDVYQTEELPADALLSAAKGLVAQTGPAYSQIADLQCIQTSGEVPPYKTTASCTLGVNGKSATLSQVSDVMGVLITKIKPTTGPHYSFKGKVLLSSLSSEVPPYKATQSAKIYVSVSVEPKAILEAAQKLKSPSNPAYFVDGKLSCNSVASEVPPFGTTDTCELAIDGQKLSLNAADGIVDSVRKIYPAKGPVYSFTRPFHVSSVSSEVPPYHTKTTAHVFLFE